MSRDTDYGLSNDWVELPDDYVMPRTEPTRTASNAVDRAAASIAGMLGVEQRANGDCHFCGQPLNRRGYCDECR